MTCARCGKANRDGARFCDGCGGSLTPRCPACGTEGRPGAAFCDSCGASLAAKPAAAAEVRKTVTIVFADLIGSTSLQERLDPESVSRVMDHYYRAVRAPVEAHGGTVVQLLGDGVMCAFGVPRVAEDDAIRAVRAAVGMQEAFRQFAGAERDVVGNVGLRVAVNTGEVVVTDERAAGIGDPLNVAARLQQEARDGDVLIGEATERLVRELVTLEPVGTFNLKGRAETVRAFRVLSLERPSGVAAAAFVGRDEELRRLLAIYESAVGTPAARLAAILGSPGVGKSRLLAELGRRLGAQATMLAARCDAAGGGTFAPLAEALREHLGLADATGGDAVRAAVETHLPGEESGRIAEGIAALLAGAPAPPEETFFVVRRLLAAVAATRPVVLTIDDVQWAEPLLLDLIEHLVQWSTTTPLLVLVAARPELRDTRSSLAAPGGLVAAVVTLGGLDAGAATRLAANVIGADELPAAIAGRVLATSEGNPLFVGELVRMLVHDGVLKREGDRWTTGVELASFEMPPTIHALLAARIERLRPAERTVLERAAVVGRQFSRAAVANLLPGDVTDLDARLEALRRSELIEPDTGWLLGEPVLRFHHVLIRDAAYRRVLKGTRAELHARFADWLEARSGEAVEHDETLGWHLEQAHQHLRELGPVDVKGRALGERAARHLGAAGRRALARDDLPLAASLLGRAIERLDAEDPARPDLALEWCEALLASGDVGPAAAAIDEVGRHAAGSDRLRAWHTCFAGQRAVLTDPQALRPTADAVAAAAETLAAAGDSAGEAKAFAVQATALGRLGEVGAAEAALDRALAAARRAHDRRRANAVLAGAPLAALWGPSPVTRASGRCLDVVRVLRITQSAPAVEAVALRCQAVLEALRGRTEAARRMIATSRRMVEELGITQRLLEADMFAGIIELLEGDAPAAERFLRAAYEGFRRQGLGIDAAQAAALLGRALLAAGRAADAEALSHESEALAGDDLQAAIAWRGVRAEALARRGEHGSAVTLARAAVDIAAATDALLSHADARLALAAALRAAGRGVEASAEELRAIELWEAKGATLLAERARRDVSRVAPAAPAVDDRAAAARPAPRRPRANAATAFAARLDTLVAARDEAAVAALLAPGSENVHHPTGTTYDREGSLTRWRAFLRAENPAVVHTPLATLGDSLALCRRGWSFDALADDDVAPFGPVKLDWIVLIEMNAQGQNQRVEYYALDHLGDAIARLYERYAELLPEGPARTLAAATAHTVANMVEPLDPDRWIGVTGPIIDVRDHRSLGYPSGRLQRERFREVLRIVYDAADDYGNRIDEILALRADALLLRRTNYGTDRSSGGAFERVQITLWTCGPDGLLTGYELFEVDGDGQALARFDELSGAPAVVPPAPTPPATRRVQANAATANLARFDAAIAARQYDTLVSLCSEDFTSVEHPTGAAYERDAVLATFRFLLSARDPSSRSQPLATLGDSLVLIRTSMTASGYSGENVDVGPFERHGVALVEVDAQGLHSRVDFFDQDKLGAALVLLYARYAELLPDGPARDRAAATARSVAALFGPLDLERVTATMAPDVEWVDHRVLGMDSGRGSEAYRRGLRIFLDLAENVQSRADDVLGLRPDMLLQRCTGSGKDRATGGTFERQLILLSVFGADGLLVRAEQFDVDRADEALARVDELSRGAQPPQALVRRRVRPNAATANAARWDAAVAARDFDALHLLLADHVEVVHHPTGLTYDGAAALDNMSTLLGDAVGVTYGHTPLATLGDTLALLKLTCEISGTRTGDYGASVFDRFVLVEVDDAGRRSGGEHFAEDHLGDAVARFYQRYADLLPEGPARARAAAIARAIPTIMKPLEPDSGHAVLAPSLDVVDHRRLAFFPHARGAESLLKVIAAQGEIAEHLAYPADDVLDLRSDAILLHRTLSGVIRASGGRFEWEFLQLWTFGADGRATRVEFFDSDRQDAALARFDALTTAPAAQRFTNAAVRAVERFTERWRARDWDGAMTTFAPTPWLDDRRRLIRLQLSGDEYFGHLRLLFATKWTLWQTDMLATRGERLALFRIKTKGDAHGVETAADFLWIVELDAQGRREGLVIFDVDEIEAAYAELDARYLAGEAAPYAGDTGFVTFRDLLAFRDALARRDWDALGALYAPDVVIRDHRRLGWEERRGRAAFMQSIRTLVDLAPDVRPRLHHVTLSCRAVLLVQTWIGTRDGGLFEDQRIIVIVNDEHGLTTCVDQYDVDQLDAARARFAEVTAKRTAPRIENDATRVVDRVRATWESRDWDGFAAIFAPGFQNTDRRKMVLVTLDREQYLKQQRPEFELPSSRLSTDVIATRGARLAMIRCVWQGSDGLTGPMELEFVGLVEVDERGDQLALVWFDPDDLDAAYAELDARFDAGEARRYPAIADFQLSFYESFARRDWAALSALYTPDLLVRDHRRLGWEEIRGRDTYVRSLLSLAELAPDARIRLDHVLGLSDTAGLVVFAWTGTRDGGVFEDQKVSVGVVDDSGRIARLDTYDLNQLDAARARFAEASARRAAPRIENAATRLSDRMDEAWPNFPRWAAFFPASFRSIDRRKHAQLVVDREQHVEAYRPFSTMTTSHLASTVLATRGDRLALLRHEWKGTDDLVGPSEISLLDLFEVDDRGELTATVLFDVDDLAAAWAELDDRYNAGEAAAYGPPPPAMDIPRCLASRDWDRLRAILSPDLVVYDHRPLGWETRHGPDAFIASLKALVELAPDARIRADHATRCERGLILVTVLVGTREGGAFEDPRAAVNELDAQGRLLRLDFYTFDQLDEARTRFAEVKAERQAPRIETAATRMTDRLYEAWQARDWERYTALIPHSLRVLDRRRYVQLVLDREQFLEGARSFFAMTTSFGEGTVFATRGDRLAMARSEWKGSEALVGPSQIDFLQLVEVDAGGKLAAIVLFDSDDLDAAYEEINERYRAEVGVFPADMPRLLARRDWEGITRMLSPDLVVYDHRPLGWETLRGRDAYVASLKSLVELAPDARIRTDHATGCERGGIVVATVLGTREGGAFEAPRVVVNELDAQGRLLRLDFYNLEQLDAALACFEALRPDPLRIPPNAATRAGDRYQEAFNRRDWRTIGELYAPSIAYDDRRRATRLTGDREMLLASLRLIATRPTSRLASTVLATAGDRLALVRSRWSGGEQGSDFEVEHLSVREVDAEGRLIAHVWFDLDDRRAASLEMAERTARARGDARSLNALAFRRALLERDLDACRAGFADDFVFHDHRRTGAGRIEGVDGYLAWIRTLLEQSPDALIESLYTVVEAPHGTLQVGHTFGTLVHGGPFETIQVWLVLFDGDRFVGTELYELEDLEVARKRFEALRPDPLRIPPNTATRTRDRWQEAFDRRDWAAVESLLAPSVEFDDRRRATRLTGDRDMLLASIRIIGSWPNARLARTVLATAGERLMLERAHWTGGEHGSRFEIESLNLIEVDAEGRIIASLVFDLDDRRTAGRQMLDRFKRTLLARGFPRDLFDLFNDLFNAIRDHDLSRCRAAVPDDFVFDDHRRTGMGRLEGAETYLAALAALFAEAPDAIIEPLYWLAMEKHGFLAVGHTFGTLAEGGEFESVYVQLALFSADGRFAGAELFEVEDLDVARARFEGLRPKPVLIPPNAASRARDLADAALADPDWRERFRALVSEDFAFDDRSRRALVSGDVELALKSYEQIRSDPSILRECELIGTMGDRIAIQRVVFGGGPPGGEFELERLRLTELDAAGHIKASVNFDPEDHKLAFAEGHARLQAGEADACAWRVPVRAFFRAYSVHEWEGMRRCLAADLVLRDHRAVGVLDGLSADAWVESMRVHAELAPDLDFESFRVVAFNHLGTVEANRIFGTATDGGSFENAALRVVLTDGKRIRHYEIFDLGDTDRALARFAELSAASSAARAAGGAPPARRSRRASRRA